MADIKDQVEVHACLCVAILSALTAILISQKAKQASNLTRFFSKIVAYLYTLLV
jgi:hypothetical protein